MIIPLIMATVDDQLIIAEFNRSVDNLRIQQISW